MKRNIVLLAALTCLLMTTASAQQPVDFRDALRMAFPATVSVTVPGQQNLPARRNQLGPFQQQMGMFGGGAFANAPAAQTSLPTGFAISADQIITQLGNDVDKVIVKTYDKTEHDGTVVARDNVTGLCVVKVDDAQLVSLVSSDGSPEPGLPVVTTWLANGVGFSKGGMIACEPNSAQPSMGFTQQIDTGNQMQVSGSPVVDANGVLVGMTVLSDSGSLVCMPAAQLNRLIDLALDDDPKDLKRGVVGIQFERNKGSLVAGVGVGSAAEKAGLAEGDLIKQINNYEVDDAQDVIAAVAMARAGDLIEVTFDRAGETLVRKVELGETSTPRATMQPLDQQGNIGPQNNLGQGNHLQGNNLQGNGGGMLRQQAWKLENGKLVPVNPGQAGEMQLPAEIQDMLKGLEGINGMPGMFAPEMFTPEMFGGPQAERSDTEEALREMEQKYNELKKKLGEPQQ